VNDPDDPRLSRVGVGGSLLLALPAASSELTAFEVQVPEPAVNDLHARLGSVRWPEKEPVSDWAQGVPMSELQDLIAYWRDGYDWRRVEAEINSLPNYRTELDGLGIHFIHVRSRDADALPLLLTHGWPGSVVEFLDSVGPLVDPTRHGGNAQDAFHLVIPSLPGFGFSDRPGERGWNHVRIARAWDQVIQFHSVDNGYWREQATRPQTLGYALADSPVGLAAWIFEKFHAWTDNHGRPQDALSNDRMLDNISTHWFTATIASSMRIYFEGAPAGPGPFNAGKIDLPIAASIFPREIYQAPKSWAQQLWSEIAYWNEVDHGGHFAARQI
jgi:hypothetical protein